MNWESLLAYDIDFNNHGHTGTTSLWQLCRNVFLQEFYHHDIANCLGWIRELFNLWEEGSSLKRQKKILQRVFTSINVQETRLSHWWGLPKRNISMNSIHIMWSSSGSQSKSWTSIIRQSPHNPRDLLYILSTDMEKAAALNSFFSECFNRNVPPIIPLDLNQLSAHLSGWLAFLLLPSCWNQ